MFTMHAKGVHDTAAVVKDLWPESRVVVGGSHASALPDWVLAEGMDVRTWIREGLIDELMLDPLEDSMGQASHDIRPWVALCKEHGVTVFGGVNPQVFCPSSTTRGQANPAGGAKMALGQLRAGVDGMEVYEAEILAYCCRERWMIPLWGNAELCRQFLANSNVEAVYPVTASNAVIGHDNHWLYGQSWKGRRGDQQPRGAERTL